MALRSHMAARITGAGIYGVFCYVRYQSVTGKRVDEKLLTTLYQKNISGTSRSYIGGL
jgi:hypothetical protein